VSAESEPQVSQQLIEEARKHIQQLYNEIAKLSEQEMLPPDYYGEFLKRVLLALSAPAGAVWMRTAQGHLQLQYQINLKQVGLESEVNRQSHDELLRSAFQQARPFYLPPHSSMGQPDANGVAAGNPTDLLILLTPLRIDQQTVGLVEVFQRPDHPPNAIPGFMQLLVRLADLASGYTRKQHLRQIVGQQQLWSQLEAFARQIHASLNPTEVAYLIANEGRRLIECDRLSVAVRHGRKPLIEAISGADVVEKRSSLVQLMRELCERTLEWGEKLVYRGSRDESLPPGVVKALDEYLQESPSKLLAILPLKDDREEKSKKPPRSALVMESFEPALPPEQLVARMEVVGKHATTALYNASEHKRIPLRFLWMPLAKLQEGLGGPAKAIAAGVTALLILLILAMIFVPYPLKMDAKGQLLPTERRWIFSPVPGQVVDFAPGMEPGSGVTRDMNLVQMRDIELENNLIKLRAEISGAEQKIGALNQKISSRDTPENERLSAIAEKRGEEVVLERKTSEQRLLRERVHADPNQRGVFWLRAPIDGTLLSWDFKETLKGRPVKPSDPLLRVGAKDKGWEVELKIPSKHIGQILQAFQATNAPKELDVDLLVVSAPTRTFKGKLSRDKISGTADPNRDDANESDPVVLASVRIDGKDIPADQRIPPDLLVTGTEVHSKVRCNDHALGYSLFYGVWEFIYEKVIFLL